MNETPAKNGQFAVIRGLPADYIMEDLKNEISIEYPSLSSVCCLTKPGSNRSRFQSARVTMDNTEELTRLKQHGVHIGFSLFRAVDWIHAPVRCFKCQRFNHVASTCRSSPRCVNCGEDHAPDPEGKCTRATKCANCDGDHRASFNGCKSRRDVMIQRQMRNENEDH